MSRLLYQDLEPQDVVLADQAYGSYVDLALVQQQGADGVFRKHHARQTDFRRGRKLGPVLALARIPYGVFQEMVGSGGRSRVLLKEWAVA